MRYAILSDIHSNLPALEAVLSGLQHESIERFICLGDTVGYGASPNECCDIVRDLSPLIVRGNHDVAAVAPGQERWFTPPARACIEWTRGELSEPNRQFLLGLQPSEQTEGAHLCHGALFDPDYYTTTPSDAALTFDTMSLPLCFIGHTHYAEWYTQDASGAPPIRHPMTEGGFLHIAQGSRYIINPGAVGQPRDGNSRAAYAIWDTERQTVELHRTAYNIKAAQEKMATADLPWNMSQRLKMGV